MVSQNRGQPARLIANIIPLGLIINELVSNSCKYIFSQLNGNLERGEGEGTSFIINY